MGCCFNSQTNWNNFQSGIPPASALITVGNETRFFSSDPCCSLNSQRFLLNVDQCCSLRYSVPPIPVISRGNVMFI